MVRHGQKEEGRDEGKRGRREATPVVCHYFNLG
jgi:hypothetical protein